MKKIILITLILIILAVSLKADTFNMNTLLVKDLNTGEVLETTPFEKIAIPVIIENGRNNVSGNYVYFAKNEKGEYKAILRI